MSGSDESSEAWVGLYREALRWAAGGGAQPLVDACVTALVAGVDSPMLRVLAGAQQRSADADAAEYSERVFEELGMAVQERFSDAAVVDGARLGAAEYLVHGGSAEELANQLWIWWEAHGYPSELDEWVDLSVAFLRLDSGVWPASESGQAVQNVRAAAQRLVDSAPSTYYEAIMFVEAH